MKEEAQLFKKFGRFFPAGTILFEEGQTCSGMYIIQKGQVRLYKKAGEEEVTIDVLQEGDFFGEMACLSGQPRSLNAVVEEGSQILVVPPEMLESLFRGTPGIGMKVVGHLAARLRKTYEIIATMILERRQTGDKESFLP